MKHVPVELEHYPGFHIRRLQQIAVAVFMEETESFGITPVQYGALSAVYRQPRVDQRTLAHLIGFDPSTIGSVIDRLEKRGLMARSNSPTDRRVRLLTVTDAGRSLLLAAEPAVLRAQQRMLEPLSPTQQAQFMDLMSLLTSANEEYARAPCAVSERSGQRQRAAPTPAARA